MLKRSNAQRVRTSWFPVVLAAEGGVKEIHLVWRYSDTSVGLFSSKSNQSQHRTAWDYIKDCRFAVKPNNHGEQHEYFLFHNRGMEKRGFRVDEMNPFLWTMNAFTSKMIELKTTGRSKLLSLYLSLLVKSEKFSGHVEEVFDDWGFKIDGEGVVEQDLVKESGSVEDYKDFVKKAILCCLELHWS